MPKVFNIQPIEKAVTTDDGSLDVHSIFETIQGEGPFAGRPAVFIRLAGCNLQCPLCDTEYTAGRVQMSKHAILDSVLEAVRHANPRPLIVLTGGEPFRQTIGPLVDLLLSKGFLVQIETNGSLYQDLPFGNLGLTIVCSPKSGSLNKKLLRHIKAFKYVVKAGATNPTDGLPLQALDHPNGGQVARPPDGFIRHSIFVQPVDTQDEAENHIHLQTALMAARQFGYTLCIQMHKIINVP